MRLSWSKVKYADKYQLYIRYPGSKKYVKAITKPASVKAIVHRGPEKGKVYRYKVRAVKKIKGKSYYSAFSKSLLVHAR